MYEKMLNKQEVPSMEDLIAYCDANGTLFQELNSYLTEEWNTQTLIRFPYGNSYGWGVKHSIKSKHICDIFAEDQAFELMLRMDNRQYEAVYDDLLPYTKEVIDGKYPCGDGGWIHYRILCREHGGCEEASGSEMQKAGKINLPALCISLFFIQRYCPRHPRRFPGIFHEAGLSASLLLFLFSESSEGSLPRLPLQ